MLFRVIILAGFAYLIWLFFASPNSPIAPFLYEMADYLVTQVGGN
jgi:threonine/homoserine/homoserine lactone efflux protein